MYMTAQVRSKHFLHMSDQGLRNPNEMGCYLDPGTLYHSRVLLGKYYCTLQLELQLNTIVNAQTMLVQSLKAA